MILASKQRPVRHAYRAWRSAAAAPDGCRGHYLSAQPPANIVTFEKSNTVNNTCAECTYLLPCQRSGHAMHAAVLQAAN